jgi:dGTPase
MLNDCLRMLYESRESKHLGQRATASTDGWYTQREHCYCHDDIRSEFQRDYTRIIHSRAFRRLRHKTQVFVSPRNDHVCTRMEHSLHVASVSQTIARALALNEDLVAAIAVGHDLGHAPFGHMGEKSLNEIAGKRGLEFSHELQSLRVVDVLESPYPEHVGLNLTFAVRDGIVCHYGEGIKDVAGSSNKFEKNLARDRNKRPEDLRKTKRGESRPATLEGCVVRWADKVAYLGRDLDDAMAVHLITKDDLPELVVRTLGSGNREIIASLVRELTRSASVSDELSVSDEVHVALNELYNFNMKRIYLSDAATAAREQISLAMTFVFDFLLDKLNRANGDPNTILSNNEDRHVLKVFVEFLTRDIRDISVHQEEQLVIDFIAGMTDSFFRESFIELFLPQSSV